METILLTVADPHIGLGHLYRCDALATALNERGVDTTLIVDSRVGHEWLASRAPETAWTVTSWTDTPVEVQRAIDNADRVIIDAYEIAPEVHRVLAERVNAPIWFDDYGSNIPERGIVINGSPGAHLVGYPERPGLVLLLGPDYQVLRKPFWQPTDRTILEHVEAVGVLLGGTDHRGLASEVLSIVRATLASDTAVYAIGVEPDSVGRSDIEATGRLTAQGMKNLFDRLDLLVTAAGQTVAEAVSCKLPTVMIQTAENQRFNVEGWSREGCALNAGRLDRVIPQEAVYALLNQSVTSALDLTQRKKLRERSTTLAMDRATRSLADILLKLHPIYTDGATAIPFPLLSHDSLKEVLTWRNDPRVSQWMENTAEIAWQDHQEFATTLARDAGKAFFRVDHEGAGLGVVDLTNIDRVTSRAELGLYRNPNLSHYVVNRTTVGTVLMHVLEDIARTLSISTLWLKVRTENGRAVRLYSTMGYRLYGRNDRYYLYEKKLL